MGVIAKNKEDYITFSTKVVVDKYIDKNGVEKEKGIELGFIDSFKFMNSSLDSLTTNLDRGDKKLFGFEGYTPRQYELLIKREFIHTSICPNGINSKKPDFLPKNRFIVCLIW